VIDGEYDQPKCCQCQATFDEGAGHQVTRLGCLHAIHTSCLVSLIKSFPPHTAPAGYVCPACSTPVSVIDSYIFISKLPFVFFMFLSHCFPCVLVLAGALFWCLILIHRFRKIFELV
jgi:hypothetical protein